MNMTGNCPYCGMWAGACVCIGVNPTITPTILQSPPPTGWVCPVCQRGVAPFMQYCDHGGVRSNTTTVTTSGTFTISAEKLKEMREKGLISFDCDGFRVA